jgi:cysteine synthase A
MTEALGGEVHIIVDPDPDSGYLGARLDYVRELCASDGRYLWLNQYTNPANWMAHHGAGDRGGVPEAGRAVRRGRHHRHVDGRARWFAEQRPSVRIVAVDSVGSVTFGGAPSMRMIPGLGASVRPPMLDESFVDEVVMVEEADTIRACHRLARGGFMFGGSTGTVVTGAMSWLARRGDPGLTSVAIAPDLGERYLDTLYQSNWVHDLYGQSVLDEGLGQDLDRRLEHGFGSDELSARSA